MKKNIIFFTISLITIFAISSCGSTKDKTKSKEPGLKVNTAFKKVYDATQQALLETNNSELKLENIDLTFTTTTTTEIGGGITLWVVSGEYKKTKTNSKTATFSFGKDEKTMESFVDDNSIKAFKEYLISVIKATKDIKSIGEFGLKEIEVEVEFILTKTIGGSFEIEISPVTPSASINREKEAVHTITLKFKK